VKLRADWRPSATLATLATRAAMLARAREYFAATNALEVETPLLVHSGVTDVHLESLEVRRPDGSRVGFLHTSPEYAMKRLLCAGAPDLFQITRVFRGGELGRRHNPEFTMIEWYRLGYDDRRLIDDVERLVHRLLDGFVTAAPSVRLTYAAAFRQRLGVDPLSVPLPGLIAALESRGVDVPADVAGDRDALLDLGMSTHVTPAFASDRLTFVTDFPASQAALARVSGPVAARFEAFWGGLELANGFHELSDAVEQRRRFAADRSSRAERGLPDLSPDTRFVDALESGLPDCAGVAVGFDRLVMLAAGVARIDEAMAFGFERA
jgi:lysyl-tRNA synthetase class 2